MEDPLDQYAKALDELDVVRHLRVKNGREEETLSAITDGIFKGVFYSRQDSQTHDARSLISNGNIDDKDSAFQDYIQLINMGKLSRFMDDFFDSEVTADRLLAVRRYALEGTTGMYSWTDYRAWRVKVGRTGTFITVPSAEVEERLAGVASILNRKTGSDAEALVNASDFFLKFIELHPFDEGNGRTARTITNTYLLKNGLRPMMITSMPKNLDFFVWSQDVSQFSGYGGAFIPNMVVAMIGKDVLNGEFLEHMKKIETANPYALGIRDSLLLSADAIGRDRLIGDIETLYKLGKEGDTGLIHSALWLSLRGGVDSWVLREAFEQGDDRTRALAVRVMEEVNLKAYLPELRAAALTGGYYTRIAAIGVLGKNGVSDERIMEAVSEWHEDIGVNCAIGVYLRNVDSSRSIDTLKSLLDHPSRNLRIRGYHATVAYGSESDVLDIVGNRLREEPKEVIKATIEEVSRTGKINSSDNIAAALTRWASEDSYVRMIVLGELSGKDNINNAYVPLLERLIGTGAFPSTDRAFALYLLGRERGFGYLSERYGAGIGEGRDIMENVALALVIAHEIGNGDLTHLSHYRPLGDERFNFTLALILARSELPKEQVIEKLNEIQAAQEGISDHASLYNIVPHLIDAVTNGKHSNHASEMERLKPLARGAEAPAVRRRLTS